MLSFNWDPKDPIRDKDFSKCSKHLVVIPVSMSVRDKHPLVLTVHTLSLFRIRILGCPIGDYRLLRETGKSQMTSQLLCLMTPSY